MSFDDADIHSLHRLVYFSRATVNAADELAPIMDSILAAAVARNARRGVSGVLLACDKWFLQALEGDRLRVGEIYYLISQDARHRDLRIIKAGPIERRDFKEWGMCGRTLSPTDDAIVSTLESRKSFDPADLSPQGALKLLETVRNYKIRALRSAFR